MRRADAKVQLDTSFYHNDRSNGRSGHGFPFIARLNPRVPEL
jgi:hypothetical protein